MLVALFNSFHSAKEIAEMFNITAVLVADQHLATKIIARQDSLPWRRFRSVRDILSLLHLDLERLEHLFGAIRT